MRTQTLCDALADLVRTGRVVKSEAGYRSRSLSCFCLSRPVQRA
jgi:hypothetical protein